MTTEDIFDKLKIIEADLYDSLHMLSAYMILLQEKIDDKSDVRQDE